MTSISDQSLLTWPTEAAAPTYADEQDALIARCLTGEETAFVALYNKYAAMIFRLTYSMLQHKEDAEEVLQDSFEYAFRRLDHYDPGKAAFKTWLYQIAISRCRNKRRRKWLPTFSLSQTRAQQVEDEKTPTPNEVLQLNDRQRIVWQALNQLSPKLRETAVLRYYEGFTYAEIGELLDIPTKTAESRMRLAHKALREHLSEVLE